MPLPNFLIVGVARCGTTSLYHYLKQHPEIGFPSIKEPKYFSSIDNAFPHNGVGDNTVDSNVIKNYKDYKNLFKGLDDFDRIGEASSDYFYHHENTIPRIKETLGDVPIIIAIRNPVDRAFSAYNNLKRDSRESLPFNKALSKEKHRIQSNWDWMWAYKAGSLYSDGVNNFKKNFTDVKVVLYDDIQTNSNSVIQEIFEFLDVDSSFTPDTSIKYSPSGQANSKIIKFISSRSNPVSTVIRSTLMKITPRNILETFAKNSFKKGEISEKTRQQLLEYFKNDIDKLEKIIDRDLENWKSV